VVPFLRGRVRQRLDGVAAIRRAPEYSDWGAYDNVDRDRSMVPPTAIAWNTADDLGHAPVARESVLTAPSA
jgi:hypothetical protein